jgi:hypothetical protein
MKTPSEAEVNGRRTGYKMATVPVKHPFGVPFASYN